MGNWSALINFVSALVCLFLMQKLTADCGFATKVARVKLVHRLSFALLAAALLYNARVTLEDDSVPRLVDFLVQAASLGVIAFSAWRHHIGTLAQAQRAPVTGGSLASVQAQGFRAAAAPAPGGRGACDIKLVTSDRHPHVEKTQ
jgi:hypothetical protein